MNPEQSYERIKKENEGKSYLEILPKDITKKSLINRLLLDTVEGVYKTLKSLPLYSSMHNVTKEDIVMYMMFGEDSYLHDNMFIPRAAKYEHWNKLCNNLSQREIDELRDSYFKEHDEEFNKYDHAKSYIRQLKTMWGHYTDRKKIANGELVNKWDMEANGYPSTSRGAMCYLFIPVKGKFPFKVNEDKSINLYNPRKKKTEVFTNVEFNDEEYIYSCLNPTGKKVFLAPYDSIEESYSCLFTINKAIFSGWWNKVMEIK